MLSLQRAFTARLSGYVVSQLDWHRSKAAQQGRGPSALVLAPNSQASWPAPPPGGALGRPPTHGERLCTHAVYCFLVPEDPL